MIERSKQRIEQNNGIFREANERIHAKTEDYEHVLDAVPFLCECPEEDCTTVVLMSASEYSSIREHPDRFFTAVGHESAEQPVADVVSRADGYVIVEKGGQ